MPLRRRDLFPRQSTATTSLSDAGSNSIQPTLTESSPVLSTGALGTPGLPTSSLTTPTLSSPSVSPTPTSPIPPATTATTTSQPPETTPSPTPTTGSQPLLSSPHSSQSSPPTTSSPDPSSSSSSGPPPTTQPPSSTSTIATSFTTYVNGTDAVVTQTPMPTTIPQSSPNSSPSNRTAIIAGSAAGATALLLLLLSLAFFARRKRFKHLAFLDTLTMKRRQARSRAILLAGEDFDDSTDMDFGRSLPAYSDYDGPRDVNQRSLNSGRGPTHARSDSGSVFREDVWPPPSTSERSRLMDTDRLIKDDIDLGRIVDDIMGPPVTTGHFSERSIAPSLRGSMADSEGIGETHSRNGSNGSNVGLLEAAGLHTMQGAALNAPTRSSPLAQPGTKAE